MINRGQSCLEVLLYEQKPPTIEEEKQTLNSFYKTLKSKRFDLDHDETGLTSFPWKIYFLCHFFYTYTYD